MGFARTTDDRPRLRVAFVSALIFNVSLVALAVSSARLAGEYAKPDLYTYEISDHNLRETRAAIEEAATNLPPANVDRRRFWASLIKITLDRAQLDVAKGYILLTPQLLPAEDGDDLKQALNDPRLQATKTRSADARMIEAAVLLLPDDAHSAWVDATTDPEPLDTFLADPLKSITDFASNLFKPKEEVEPPTDPFEIDDAAKLVQAAQLRAVGKPIDPERFKLNAFAQFLPGTKIMDSGDGGAIRKAAAVWQGARASGKLQPALQSMLNTKLQQALPDHALNDALKQAVTAPGAQKDPQIMAKAVATAFEKSADPKASADLASLLKRMTAIATATSQEGAASLLTHVNSSEDLQKLQLTTQAGGLRVLALSQTMKNDTLSLARGTVRARAGINLAFGGIAASAAGLLGTLIYTLTQALRRYIDMRNRENLKPAT